MKMIYEYSRGCEKHPNEDEYGVKDTVAWVLDGATAVFKNNYISNDDVQWVIQRINKNLHECNSSQSLQNIFRDAITAVQIEAFNIAPYIASIPQNKLPTYSICMVQLIQSKLNYLCLGDCSLFISAIPNMRVTDRRILPFHYQVNNVKAQFQNDPQKYKKEVYKIVCEMKNYINVEGGYWIGSLSPEITEKCVLGSLDVQQGERILICSDGFRPSLDEANLVDFRERDIFDLFMLKKIIESQVLSEEQYYAQTGIDLSDDKTVLLLEV